MNQFNNLSELSKDIIDIANSKKKEAIQLLQKLISFDTTIEDQGRKGREGPAQKWLAKYLEAKGFEVDVFEPDISKIEKYRGFTSGHYYNNRPNVVGLLKGKGNGRTLLINSHIDTMPFGHLSNWEHKPTRGNLLNDKIYGRGACDAKGCLSAAIMAIECVTSLGIKLDGDLRIESVVDEEGGGNGTISCIDRGYEADAAIVIEPTFLNIFLGHMGWMFFDIQVEGKATHASIKNKGVNAIEKSLKVIDSIREIEKEWSIEKGNPLFPKSTINIGQVNGGVAGSMVPDRCEIKICLHYYPNDGIADQSAFIESFIKNRITQVSISDEWLSSHNPKITKYQEGDPYQIPVNHDLVKCLSDSIKSILKTEPIIGGAPFGSDARLLTNIAGIPTVVFGPGRIEQAHGIDEYLDIQQYINYIKILTLSIIRWTSPNL